MPAYRVCAPPSEQQLIERFGPVFEGVERRVQSALLNFDFVWQNKKGGVSRYSDGKFAVLYSAATAEVAIVEKGYWVKEILLLPLSVDISLEEYIVYPILISGAFREVFAKDNPMVVHPKDYTVCNEIGRRAWEDNISYLRVPSARCHSGVCIPVFDADSAEVLPSGHAGVVYSWRSADGIICSHHLGATRDVDFDDVYGEVVSDQ